MKLTNLSLAILVALGVAACGGSDSNDKQTVDPGNGGNGGSTTTTTPTTPPKPDDGPTIVKDPNNMGNLKIEKRFEDVVAVNKKIYANRSGEDTLGGYRIPQLPGMEMQYEAGATKTPDVLRASSITNYLAAGWVNNSNALGGTENAIRLNPLNTYAKTGVSTYNRVVAIIRNDNGIRRLVTWDQAKPGDEFYYISTTSSSTTPVIVSTPVSASNLYYVPNAMAPSSNGLDAAGAFSKSDFLGVSLTVKTFDSKTGVVTFNDGAGDLKAFSDLYNALGGVKASSIGLDPTKGVALIGQSANLSALGNINLDGANPSLNVLDSSKVDYSAKANAKDNVFDVTFDNVEYESVDINGKNYNLRNSVNGVELDLSSLPMTAEKIQKLPITLHYSVTDTKGTHSAGDDDTRQLSTGAGELRVYNLNYSRALVEVNQAAAEDSTSADAAVRNGLGFVGNDLLGAQTNGMVRGYIYGFGNVSGQGSNGAYGPFQVAGYQTPTLPDNGRAKYIGKSFGVNSEGTVQLEADFGLDRAGISGVIVNRQDVAGNKLDDMNLNTIQLSQPGLYRLTASAGMDSAAAGSVNNGVVDLGGTKNWGVWAVKLFGPNAENAGGVIAEGSSLAQRNGSNLTNVVEAFNSVRGDINPKSLNNPTDWSK